MSHPAGCPLLGGKKGSLTRCKGPLGGGVGCVTAQPRPVDVDKVGRCELMGVCCGHRSLGLGAGEGKGTFSTLPGLLLGPGSLFLPS